MKSDQMAGRNCDDDGKVELGRKDAVTAVIGGRSWQRGNIKRLAALQSRDQMQKHGAAI